MNYDVEGFAELAIKTERCRRLARQSSDPIAKAGLLELAAEYEVRMKPTGEYSLQILVAVTFAFRLHTTHRISAGFESRVVAPH
jgi:hypothetical protein